MTVGHASWTESKLTLLPRLRFKVMSRPANAETVVTDTLGAPDSWESPQSLVGSHVFVGFFPPAQRGLCDGASFEHCAPVSDDKKVECVLAVSLGSDTPDGCCTYGEFAAMGTD